MSKRVFLIVLDSMGIGELPDAAEWLDEGSNTLGTIRKHPAFNCPNLEKLGLFAIDGVGGNTATPIGSYARMSEASKGKDTTIGHWEIGGIVSEHPLPTYPDGFPQEILEPFMAQTGRGILANAPWSGTAVIEEYGADALRFMLANGTSPGNDMRYGDDKIKAARNFANKLWNAARFVLMNLPEDFEPGLPAVCWCMCWIRL